MSGDRARRGQQFRIACSQYAAQPQRSGRDIQAFRTHIQAEQASGFWHIRPGLAGSDASPWLYGSSGRTGHPKNTRPVPACLQIFAGKMR